MRKLRRRATQKLGQTAPRLPARANVPFPIIQVPTIKFLLPGKSTANVAIDVGVAAIDDPQAISMKDANADAAAKSIWLLAPKIVRKQALLMRKVVQQRHRHNLKRLHLSVLLVVFAVHLLDRKSTRLNSSH